MIVSLYLIWAPVNFVNLKRGDWGFFNILNFKDYSFPHNLLRSKSKSYQEIKFC